MSTLTVVLTELATTYLKKSLDRNTIVWSAWALPFGELAPLLALQLLHAAA